MPIIQSVARALAILELFDDTNRELSIKEISVKLDLNKSTVHSLLKTLKEYGYISQNNETTDYSLGWKLYERGHLMVSQLDIRNVARVHLEKLNEQTNQTVHLVTLLGKEAIYIDKINGHSALVIYSRIGKRVPLHSSGVGKVLAAFLDESQLKSLMDGYIFEKTTVNTIDSYKSFVEELEGVREKGYAADFEENEPGIICIAMPVHDFSGEVIAAISVSTPKSHINDEVAERNYQYLKECVEIVSSNLGYKKIVL
ncbi:IclR family transcriptional regulator [Ureibacillus chungkukjangi]|uniref:Glycerol operon regulatory protein n=1 Tax=Ureibacillus chungkukjangi TaxID=1202712 RepID=A0A318TK14_9BACL|nr:IclR family transcriptional regulator [Ureibacillus chungkukjangi]MCM3387032.1 IclR family transcriptional regulator [Ureibacillus chungkukjangi]PYF05231.1 IclR family transcriptional regulator [Ureibacillus chungkukjangi]